MKYKIDTHMHTTASDGTLYPEELLKEVIENNISVFSVTDHDSIDSIETMKNLTRNLDLVFIPGVEISVTYLKKEIHLLTYGDNISKNNSDLMEIINYNKKVRIDFENKFMDFISKRYDVSLHEYDTFERNPKEGGWKSFNFLLNKNIVKSLLEVFDLVKESGLSFVFKSPKEVIPKLKEFGLTVILAHPPAYYKNDLLEKDFLEYFTKLGIDGIECISPYYDDEEHIDYYKDYCINNDLLIMSGSDYHGKLIPTRKLGLPERIINKPELDKILNRILSN